MRAFGFEKEPVFKAMEATSIWGSLISAGASIAGGLMGADAAKDAAKREYAANKQALELQKQQREEAKAYLSPYYERGAKGDAYLDALLYGEGSYGGEGSDPSTARNMEDVLREQNPGAAKLWAEWESKDKGKPNGHRAVYGDFEGFIRQTKPEAFQAAQAALKTGAGGAGAGGKKVTRTDAISNLQKSIPWRLNNQDYLKAQGFTDNEIAAWVAKAEAEQGKSIDAISNRFGITGQRGSAERGVAQVGEDYARDRAQYEAGRRRADYSGYAAGRLSAYGSYLDGLQRDSDRGYQAGTGLASGGQTYANNAGNLLSNGARTQAGYANDASEAWAKGIQGAAGYLADGYAGSRKKANYDGGYKIPESYGDYESVGGGYGDYSDASSGYFNTKPRKSANSNMYAGLY